eukprot:TRINITY_DN5834_c0_g3_i1.p1 TRINITY_DN5834_c0_g3~~TRINITY_DN5834_c0_g3_i1.p1  ORF type:complete len:257 (+),score=86.30 TRINITY_DN5834_c0_g3_i1:69-773(+)
MGRKVASTSRTPGHTKYLQSMILPFTDLMGDKIELCDSPGLLFPAVGYPRYLLETYGLVPISQVREPFTAIRFLANRMDLLRLYGAGKPLTKKSTGRSKRGLDMDSDDELEDTPFGICDRLAEKNGWLLAKVGRPDCHRAGLFIIKDAVDGALDCSMPVPTELPVDIGEILIDGIERVTITTDCCDDDTSKEEEDCSDDDDDTKIIEEKIATFDEKEDTTQDFDELARMLEEEL